MVCGQEVEALNVSNIISKNLADQVARAGQMVGVSTQTDFESACAMPGPDRKALCVHLVLLGVLGNASRAAQCGSFSHN